MTDLQAQGINGHVRFDGATIFIKRTGIGVMNHGRVEKSYPIGAIGAIQYKPATSMVNGHLQLSPAGEQSKANRRQWTNSDLAKDENAVIFRKSAVADFDALVAAIRAAQAAPAGTPTAAPDVTDQLAKLGQLRDAGVLTEDEFNAKKTELLGRL